MPGGGDRGQSGYEVHPASDRGSDLLDKGDKSQASDERKVTHTPSSHPIMTTSPQSCVEQVPEAEPPQYDENAGSSPPHEGSMEPTATTTSSGSNKMWTPPNIGLYGSYAAVCSGQPTTYTLL